MAENQFDPQGMVDKMVEVIPQTDHEFRTVHPEKFIADCQEYQNRQYKIKIDTIDKSKK